MKAAILSIYMSPTNFLVAYAVRERVAGGERVFGRLRVRLVFLNAMGGEGGVRGPVMVDVVRVRDLVLRFIGRVLVFVLVLHLESRAGILLNRELW